LKREEVLKTSAKQVKSPSKDEKAETLWEIFEKTGSIGAYLLYSEHVDTGSLEPEKDPDGPTQ